MITNQRPDPNQPKQDAQQSEEHWLGLQHKLEALEAQTGLG
jgi:hypothetical protein